MLLVLLVSALKEVLKEENAVISRREYSFQELLDIMHDVSILKGVVYTCIHFTDIT